MLKLVDKSSVKTEKDNHKLAFLGLNVLTPKGWINDANVLIEDGKFVSILDINCLNSLNDYKLINCQGLQMLPGIIDLHGDAFERMICPRPGISIPLPLAIIENDRNLLAAGITTFYCSITDSYEPGLRSRDTARNLINFIHNEGRKLLSCNHQIHIRHEQANIQGHEELCDWLKSGRIQLLSLNNHLPSRQDKKQFQRYLNGLQRRVSLSETEIDQFLSTIEEQQEIGLHQVEELVELAHAYEIPLASHDDDSAEKVETSKHRQVAIAEFPASITLATKCRAYGAAVLMGAPNLIRGSSHVGYMSVAEAVEYGVLDCLCSDYHYPSLFYAPFKLHELGLMPFEQAWELVSSHPAAAVGIGNRKGKIAPGMDADFLLVTPNHSLPSAISSVYIAGCEVARYSSEFKVRS